MLLSIITIVCAFFAGILAGLVDKAQSKFPKAKYKAFWDFLYQHRLWLRLGAVSLSILAYALGVTALYSNVPYPHVPFIAPAVICFFLLLLGYTTIHIKTFLQLRSYKNIFEYTTRETPFRNLMLNSILLISFLVLSVDGTIFFMQEGKHLLYALEQAMCFSAILIIFALFVAGFGYYFIRKITIAFIDWLKH